MAHSKDLGNCSLEIAEKIASKLSLAVKIGKKAFYKQAEMEIDHAYSYASSVIVENLLYKETNQGMNDFLNKNIVKTNVFRALRNYGKNCYV